MQTLIFPFFRANLEGTSSHFNPSQHVLVVSVVLIQMLFSGKHSYPGADKKEDLRALELAITGADTRRIRNKATK